MGMGTGMGMTTRTGRIIITAMIMMGIIMAGVIVTSSGRTAIGGKGELVAGHVAPKQLSQRRHREIVGRNLFFCAVPHDRDGAMKRLRPAALWHRRQNLLDRSQ
jgi:hypothetical protein